VINNLSLKIADSRPINGLKLALTVTKTSSSAIAERPRCRVG